MAKKKRMGWDFDDETAAKAAKSSIEKTSRPKPVKKKKIGRPVVTEGEKAKVSITVVARSWAKKVAALNDETMTEYLSNLIIADAEQRGIKKT